MYRKSFGGSSRGRSFGGNRFGQPRFNGGGNAGRSSFTQKGRNSGEKIHPSKFINKAVITEEAEHFVPEHKFEDFKISPELKRNIEKRGYQSPTPIQDRTIPQVLNGLDLVGIANTGTGKTAAFLIPLINKTLAKRTEKTLIIVPTRELAIQIDEEFRHLAKNLGLFSVCVVGGTNMMKQIRDLRRQYHFVIGTPGRLKDLMGRRIVNLARFNSLVLDEADRMLDMGFIGDMRLIIARLPRTRQTLFFSATISEEVEKLIGEFLHEPIRISVKTGDTAKTIDQDVIKFQRETKLDILHDLLNQKDFEKVLIFGRTKHGVERLTKMLVERGFRAESIHGNKNHSKRQRALSAFKDDKVQILVATDVAARGLDIPDVSHVINYDLPATYDDYVHRIGRTGRASKKGKALTFIE